MNHLHTRENPMSDTEARTKRLLDRLYAAAEVLIDSITDPTIIEESPLPDRAAALATIERFIDRIEKREADRATAAAQAQLATRKQQATERRASFASTIGALSDISTQIDSAFHTNGSAQSVQRALS
jgi:hypothetical protein